VELRGDDDDSLESVAVRPAPELAAASLSAHHAQISQSISQLARFL